MRVLPGALQRAEVDPGETCPVCLDPYHGGSKIRQGVDGLWRSACVDEHACLDAYMLNGLSESAQELREKSLRRPS